MTTARIDQLRSAMRRRKIDAFLISHIPSIQYLTGFSGSSATLLLLMNELHFITDGRYEQQVQQELLPLENMKIHIQRNVWDYVREQGILENCNTLAFEQGRTSYAEVIKLRSLLRPIRLKPVSSEIIDSTTIVKTEQEIGYIAEASRIGDEVFSHLLTIIKPGVREHELAAEISYQGRLRGAEADAFDIIVASGERSALPHGRATDRQLQSGDMITFDFGFRYQGLHSDMTRTVMLGTPSEEQRKVYELVRAAEQAAEQAVQAGMLAAELDAIARDMITAAGYGEAFNHSLGHGLGRVVHESPGISFRSGTTRLQENSVITIEPGVYLPGKFGVRIENDVVVQKDGCRILNTSPRELIIL